MKWPPIGASAAMTARAEQDPLERASVPMEEKDEAPMPQPSAPAAVAVSVGEWQKFPFFRRSVR